jgi:hypothetical protein
MTRWRAAASPAPSRQTLKDARIRKPRGGDSKTSVAGSAAAAAAESRASRPRTLAPSNSA